MFSLSGGIARMKQVGLLAGNYHGKVIVVDDRCRTSVAASGLSTYTDEYVDSKMFSPLLNTFTHPCKLHLQFRQAE